jgi:glycosyltransferase involved in cell wall biosynthesis
MNSAGQTICLSMIVKNEASVIRRCLDSVRPLIDHWVIVDTGSTDGTQDIIRAHLKDLPGELVERPWQDFAHNRSEALALARPHADYTFIIDADDALELSAGFVLPALTADSYTVDIQDTNAFYQRQQFVRAALPWRYAGVLHEFLTCDGAGPQSHLPIVMRRNHDGARRNDPTTYQRDAAILEAALARETDPFLISRYTFYLAQSYRDSSMPEKALEKYLARAELGYWHEEVYMALLHAARIKESLGHAEQEVIDTYLRAAAICPNRTEALHGASRFCRFKGRNEEGYQIAKRGIDLKMPGAGLFLEPWIYETGLLDEFAVNAYWSDHPRESLDATLRILGNKNLPQEQWQRFSDNARFALQKLPKDPNLGSLGAESFADQHKLQPPRNLRSVVAGTPRVLMAILAKQKEAALPLYLECLEALDYPKSAIVLYIRTNNNTDRTEQILRDWVARVGHLYAGVEFNAEDVAARVQEFGAHEWNAARFRVLGHIRNVSLRKTVEHGCDFYFVADVDNFIRPCTLRELVALNLPIVAPMLRSIQPGSIYSNYHAEVDANGYYKECDQYHWILNRSVRGVFEMPVVHCTYLVRADVLDDLTYQDGTDHFEYVIFSNSARRNSIPQYFNNRQVYGYITFDKAEEMDQARSLLRETLPADSKKKTLVFCTAFSRTLETWNRRYRRWLDSIRQSGLDYETILLIDDGSPVLPEWEGVSVRATELLSPGGAEVEIIHFDQNLGRGPGYYPGWYRSYAFAAEYAEKNGFDKVVHIESDTYVITDRMVRHINSIEQQWHSFWTEFYQKPESAIQVVAGDSVVKYRDFTRQPYEQLVGPEIEHFIPFDVINKEFSGDRYSEFLENAPRLVDYVVQATEDLPDAYFWWLNARKVGPQNTPGSVANITGDGADILKSRLLTCFNTIMYVDPESLEIRHGAAFAVPLNLYVVHSTHAAVMVYDHDERLVVNFTQHKGRLVEGTDAAREMTPVFQHQDMAIGGRSMKSGLRYLTAEPDGRVALRAIVAHLWEKFEFVEYKSDNSDQGEPVIGELLVRAVEFSPSGRRLQSNLKHDHSDLSAKRERISAARDAGGVQGGAKPPWCVFVAKLPGYVHSAALDEMTTTICGGLRRLGKPFKISSNVDDITVNTIIIGGHLMSQNHVSRIPQGAVTYNSENVFSFFFDEESEYYAAHYLSLLKKTDVWDYSYDNSNKMQERYGIDVRYVPLGFVSELVDVVPADEEDIDVLFYGSSHPRRAKVLDELSGRGLRVHHAFGIYGEERRGLIARAKVVLNMHAHLPGAFEIVRVGYLLANQKCVVTEVNPGETIDDDVKDGVLGVPYDDLVSSCVALVRDNDRRFTLAAAGSRIFRMRDEGAILQQALGSLI